MAGGSLRWAKWPSTTRSWPPHARAAIGPGNMASPLRSNRGARLALAWCQPPPAQVERAVRGTSEEHAKPSRRSRWLGVEIAALVYR